MNPQSLEDRFLQYQIRAIRRFQSNHKSATPEEAEQIAIEWVSRFAAQARTSWERRVISEDKSFPTLIRQGKIKSVEPTPRKM